MILFSNTSFLSSTSSHLSKYKILSKYSSKSILLKISKTVVLTFGLATSVNASRLPSTPLEIDPVDVNLNCPHQNVTFNINTIFNEQDKDILLFHRWVNALHITTKEFTLKNETAFFLNKCNKNKTDLAELERHLRAKKFIRDAKVSADNNLKNILVETWDNWSLTPTISYGRKGGVNTYSLGLKDRNLLGLGIDTQIQSFSNAQRSGYKLETSIPLFLKQNSEVKIVLSDNDDGKQTSLFVVKNFASLLTPYAYNVGFNSEKRNDTIFQNKQISTIFKHNITYRTASYAWLTKRFNSALKNKDDTLRLSLGLTQDQHLFSTINDQEILSPFNLNKKNRTTNTIEFNELASKITQQNGIALPKDRDFIYPWFNIEYIENDFKKLTNIHLVSQFEDFNFGWHVNAKLGIADGNKTNSAWALWRSNISKGFSINEKSLTLLNFYLASDLYNDNENRFFAKIEAELFYHLSDQWNFYLANSTVFSDNQYIEQPITLGGDSGMRGFPLQYQHGKNSFKVTSELRYYPHINVYKLFELAGTIFIDVGKASGNTLTANIDNGWIYSLGIGARIYSTHASLGRVVHIDLAKPFSDNPELGGFEIRLQAKETF